MFYRLILIALLLSTSAQADDFSSWVARYKQRAIAAGVSAEAVHRAMEHATYDASVILLDRKQFKSNQTLLDYVDQTVTAKRIARGREKFRQNLSILKSIENRTGVPAEIMAALWGKESDFGGNTGTTQTISALATLAFEGRRREFFEQELLNAIVLADRLGLNPGLMRGSWAGALGQCQFMPSNYIRIARDGNSNGRIDLWHELPDVFASTANLLLHEGWRPHESWGQKITLPHRFDKFLIGRDKSPRAFRFWEQRGVRFSKPVPASVQQAIRIYQPDGPSGPAYALYPNFDVLMRWNRSGYFAVAVGRLADHISTP